MELRIVISFLESPNFFISLKFIIMKKLLLMLVISAMVSTVAIAQEKDVKQDRAEWEKKMKDELKLTADQTVKYDALNKEYNDKIDALMSDASISKDVQKDKKMALKKEKETKLMEFLTPEQQAKYKEIMDKKKKETAEKTGS
jgi:Spy/CpxP family protein refolding chaperone